MAGIGLLGAIALAGLIVAVYAAWLFHDLPDASELADYRPPTATRVYAGDGTLIGEFSDERRIYVSYDQIPTTVIHAFLAAEDRNFFQHGGIDVGGIGRASLKNVFNLAQGRRLEGGSTITQQVAKNVLLTSETSLNRKLKEAILASRLLQASQPWLFKITPAHLDALAYLSEASAPCAAAQCIVVGHIVAAKAKALRAAPQTRDVQGLRYFRHF